MSGLPWIKAHVDLPRHHKSIRLAARLEEPRAWTWVVQLWFWAAEYQPTGLIECPEAELIITRGAGWAGDPDAFVRHLVAVGFLDKTPSGYAIHDWPEYAGAHVEKRKKDADRKRRSRGGHTDIQRTAPGVTEESARKREMESETTTNTLSPREAGAEAAAVIDLRSPAPHPHLDALVKALREAGKVPAYPKADMRASVDAAVASVGVTTATSRVVLAWNPATPHLGWYLAEILGTAKKQDRPAPKAASVNAPAGIGTEWGKAPF